MIEQLPSKKSAILDHMRDLVQKFVDKSLLEFSYTHQLIWEYAEEVQVDSSHKQEDSGSSSQQNISSRMLDLLELLVDSVAKLLTTKAGAKVVCRLATCGSAKDRKRMLKPLKGHVVESLCHESAHLGIMRLIEVVDDTVTAQKCIFEELRSTAAVIKYSASGEIVGTPVPVLATIAMNKFARKFLMRLLVPDSKNLEPDEAILFQERNLTSKKAPEAKRREHLYYIRSSLINVFANYANILARDKYGYQVLFSALQAFCPQELVSALCRVFTGQTINHIEGDDTAMVESGYGSEEENENEMESGNENESDEDSSDSAEEEGAEQNETIQDMEVEEDSIQENPSAHLLFKLMCQMQMSYEELHPPQVAPKAGPKSKKPRPSQVAITADHRTIAIDDSFWESGESGGIASFGKDVLSHLQEQNLIPIWLSCNRPCFALSELSKIPSVNEELKSFLSSTYATELKKGKKKHSGGKLLADLIL